MLKILELFGGIRACSKALERLGIEYECVDYVDIDKYAVKSVNAIYDSNYEPQDICDWNKDIEVDLIMHGSPCQDFSIAGSGKGGNLGSGTRSSLLYETVRIVEKLRPKYILWENVKNLLSKKHIHNFNAYLYKLEQLGYTNYYQLLNAKDYGIPQNRERIFTLSIRNDIDKGYIFPKPFKLDLRLIDILEQKPIIRLGNFESKTICYNSKGGRKGIPNLQPSVKDRIYSIYGISTCITTSIFYMPKYLLNGKIYTLSAKECWRLMGFDDVDYEKAASVNSITQLYKQAGNSIVVNVLVSIFKELLL